MNPHFSSRSSVRSAKFGCGGETCCCRSACCWRIASARVSCAFAAAVPAAIDRSVSASVSRVRAFMSPFNRRHDERIYWTMVWSYLQMVDAVADDYNESVADAVDSRRMNRRLIRGVFDPC